MTTSPEFTYRPACLPTQPGTCARCDLAYDCQSKMSGRMFAWPVLALAVAGLLAFLI